MAFGESTSRARKKRDTPANVTEAQGSLVGEMPAARLYWASGRTEEAKAWFFLHHGRWVAYVYRMRDRANAFLDLGARDQARVTLREILPDIEDDSPGMADIGALADELGLEISRKTR